MALLEKYKEEMTGLGIPEERIELKTPVRRLGVAQDIIEFAQEKAV